MSTLYNRLQKQSTSLLTKFGHDIELVDSTKTTLDTYKGLSGPVRVENTPASVVEKATATVYVSVGAIEPKLDHYLRINGSIWKIIYIDPIKPTDTAILYTLFVRQ